MIESQMTDDEFKFLGDTLSKFFRQEAVITSIKPLYPPAHIIRHVSEGIHPTYDPHYFRKVLS